MGHTFSIFKESTSANLLFCYITEKIVYQIAAFLPFLIISLCILYESSLFGKFAQIHLNIFVQILVLKFSKQTKSFSYLKTDSFTPALSL